MLVDESYNGGQCLISLSEGRPRHEGNETLLYSIFEAQIGQILVFSCLNRHVSLLNCFGSEVIISA